MTLRNPRWAQALDSSSDQGALWHDLLERAVRAERLSRFLIDEIVRDHEERHSDPMRWCRSTLCRAVESLSRHG